MAAMAVMTTFQLTAFFLVPYCVLMALGVQGLQVGDVVASAAFILMISSFVPLPGRRRSRGQFLCVLPDVLQGIGQCERCDPALADVHLLSAHCGGGLFCPASVRTESPFP